MNETTSSQCLKSCSYGPEHPNRMILAIMLFSAGLLIVSVKWLLIDHYGVDVPYLDQWGAEATDFSRFEQGQLQLGDLFRLHNEHCIVTTRIWHLAWYVINGHHWDTRLQMVLGAIIQTLTLLLIFRATIDTRRLGSLMPSFLVLLSVGVIPLGWSNLLGGFQVQFHWALIFQVIAMLLWLGRPPLSWQWWTGFLSYFLGTASMASGGMIIFAVAVVLAMRAWKERHRPTAMAAGILLVVGGAYLAWIMSNSIEGHAHLKAHSVIELVVVFLKGMSAPYMDHIWPAFILWLPMAVMTVRILLNRQKIESLDQRLVCMGLWVAGLAAATAYARGGDGLTPANRYLDNNIIGLLVNISCLLRLRVLIQWPEVWRRFKPVTVLMAIWVLVLTGGFAQSMQFYNPQNQSLEGWVIGMRNWKAKTDLMSSQIHGYLSTHDMKYLANAGIIPLLGLPEAQKKYADDPAIVNVLPTAIRAVQPPTHIQASGKAGGPVFDDNAPLLRTTRFGISPIYGDAPAGSVTVHYQFPADARYFVVQARMLPHGQEDIGLYCRSGAETQTLIEPKGHAAIQDGSLYFKTSSGTFALEAIDHGWSKGGILSLTTPIPIGPVSFWMERLHPWTPLLGAAGLIGVLYCCFILGRIQMMLPSKDHPQGA